MANLLLEREIQIRQAEQQEAVRKDVSAAESEHSRRISENYKKLISSEAGQRTQSLYESAGEYNILRDYASPKGTVDVIDYAPAPVAAPEEIPSAAQRFADYKPVSATPATKRRLLFEGLSYKDGELLGAEPVAAEAAPVAAPVTEPDEDDALPTRRTMNTLKRASAQMAEAEAEEGKQVALSQMLSSKAKVVLAAIALVIIVAIAVICINTSILSSLDAQIADIQAVNAELQANEAAVQEAIAEVTSRENVVEWALSQNMVIAP